MTKLDQGIVVPTADSKAMYLIRTPNDEWLCRSSGLEPADIQKLKQMGMLHIRDNGKTTSNEASYLESAKKALLHAITFFDSTPVTTQDFAVLLKRYTELSAYKKADGQFIAKPVFRDRASQRGVFIPVFVKQGFSAVLAANSAARTQIYTSPPGFMEKFQLDCVEAKYDESTKPYGTVVQDLANLAKLAKMYKKEGKEVESENATIEFYRQTEISWLWEFGNHSRSSNLFNALRHSLGQKPTPHGLHDLAAFLLDPSQFQTYMKHNIRLSQGTTIAQDIL